ncbi:MAG: hypothetical protein ACFE8G_00905 [Candidatus Hermodarchaeota archaeon]
MANKSILAIGLAIFCGFSTIISIPIILITIGFSPYIIVDHHDYREFVFNSSAVIDLNLNIDVGNVDIKYSYDPVDYHAKVNLNIEMIGQNIPSKTYTDYFNIEWDNTNTSFTFTMELLEESEFDEIMWEKKDIDVFITLNAGILFNINTSIIREGNVSLLVERWININIIDIYSKKGNILFDFEDCIIGGNIKGNADVGNINLHAINVQYAQNSVWNLTANFDIDINIIQNTTLSANITGTVSTNQGVITLLYTDNNPNAGATFSFFLTEGQQPPFGTDIGFTETSEEVNNGWWVSRHIYNSLDFPAIGNYNLSFYSYNPNRSEIHLKNV